VGNRILNLELAIRCYKILMDECDSDDHPFHYATLQNSLELAETEHSRINMTTKLAEANDDNKFEKSVKPEAVPRVHGKMAFWKLREEPVKVVGAAAGALGPGDAATTPAPAQPIQATS
jgi:hypothetical protein